MTTSQTARGPTEDGDRADFAFWRDHTTISLQPVAAPSILGLYGLAAATFVLGANLAGWYGNASTPMFLSPFVLAFGVAQLLAAMWAYRARDGLATAVHGAWGSFGTAFGIYYLLVAAGALAGLSANTDAMVAFGYWFIGLAAITWVTFVAALADNIATSVVLLALAISSTLLAIGLTSTTSWLVTVGAIILIIAAVLAWYTASAILLADTTKRVTLPIGKLGAPKRPGEVLHMPIQYEAGEPGVKVGQ